MPNQLIDPVDNKVLCQEGDTFVTPSGDKFKIDAIGRLFHFSHVTNSLRRHDYQLSTAVMYFRDGSWKIEAKNNNSNFVMGGNTIKVGDEFFYLDGSEGRRIVTQIVGENIFSTMRKNNKMHPVDQFPFSRFLSEYQSDIIRHIPVASFKMMCSFNETTPQGSITEHKVVGWELDNDNFISKLNFKKAVGSLITHEFKFDNLKVIFSSKDTIWRIIEPQEGVSVDMSKVKERILNSLYDHAYRKKELSKNEVTTLLVDYKTHFGKDMPEFMRK